MAHGKTAAQVGYKWVLQKGATVALSSTNLQHLQDDLNIFDFELTEAEMMQLDTLRAATTLKQLDAISFFQLSFFVGGLSSVIATLAQKQRILRAQPPLLA